MIKTKIIEKSIELLKTDGLKFSVDELATSLKISKKTIYKYFKDKEDLAMELYKKIFNDITIKMDIILTKNSDKEKIVEILTLFEYSLIFCDENILNRYSLNQAIIEYVELELEILWQKIEIFIRKSHYGEKIDNVCFKDTIFATLKAFNLKKDDGKLVKSLVELIFGESK